MDNQQQLEELFAKYECSDFKWAAGKDIDVAQWVRVKCMYGCNDYGKRSACPPNVPSVDECKRFFCEYSRVVVFHFKAKFDMEQLDHWCAGINHKLSKLENDVFLAGFHKAFALFVDRCSLCTDCASERSECKNKRISRPCTEAFAVDVYGTVRKMGYPIQVIKENEEMNRYAILLIE